MRFIYVMRKEDVDKLENLGYRFIKEDENNHVWIFENKECENFSAVSELDKAGIGHVLSDILMF